jgi:rRNA-processing protein EBP2
MRKQRYEDDGSDLEEEDDIDNGEDMNEGDDSADDFDDVNEDDDEDEGDEEEDAMEMAALLAKSQAKNPLINNKPALQDRLADIVLGGGAKIPWVESFSCLSRTTAESLVEDVNDDLKRELAFYDIALAGVKDCQEMCRSSGVSYERPTDYYAEMVKSDGHMLKVKKELLEQAAKIEASELRRKQRDAKKFGKALQVERNQEKEKKKKDELDSIKKWRKTREQSGGMAGKDDDELDEMLNKGAGKLKRKGLNDFIEEKTGRKADGGPRKSAKRLAADKKYGRGGKERTQAKRNTFESAHDMSDFNPKQNKRLPAGMRVNKTDSFKKSGKAAANRPGKQKRQFSRRH